jgi:HPt (histidine-containing phosphotransfer) domain-containing protein
MQTRAETAVDFEFLEAFVGGDAAVADEVLALFQHQAELWTPMLDETAHGWRDAVHALKGAAGGIGAGAVRAACETAERADPAIAGPALTRVRDALDQALVAIAGRRHRHALSSLRG